MSFDEISPKNQKKCGITCERHVIYLLSNISDH